MRRLGVWAVLLVTLGACSASDPAITTGPVTTVAVPSTHEPDPFASFDRRTITVSGERWTVAIADTPELRSRGLMGVTDLGDLDGMLFVFEADTDGGFWMKDTLIPLDIAFFAVDGTLVDLLTMEPCLGDPCPVYHPRGSYRYAIETAVGRWDAIDQPVLE